MRLTPPRFPKKRLEIVKFQNPRFPIDFQLKWIDFYGNLMENHGFSFFFPRTNIIPHPQLNVILCRHCQGCCVCAAIRTVSIPEPDRFGGNFRRIFIDGREVEFSYNFRPTVGSRSGFYVNEREGCPYSEQVSMDICPRDL